MPFLLHWPIWLSALFVYALSTGLALAIGIGIGAWVRRHPTRETTVGGLVPPVGAAMTAGFLVWLGLLASTELRGVEDAERAVATETRALYTLDMLGRSAAPEAGAELRVQLADYASHALAREFPSMSDHGADPGTRLRLETAQRSALTRFGGESPELRAALRQAMQDLADARLRRIGLAIGHIPSVIWYALLVSALVVLSFAALVHARQPRAARWIALLLGLLIGAQLHAVYVIDRPFVGAVSVSDESMRGAVQQLQAAPGATQAGQ